MTEEVDEDAGLRGALLREYFRERRERGLEYKNDYPEGSEDWKLARLAEEIRRRWDRELFFSSPPRVAPPLSSRTKSRTRALSRTQRA